MFTYNTRCKTISKNTTTRRYNTRSSKATLALKRRQDLNEDQRLKNQKVTRLPANQDRQQAKRTMPLTFAEDVDVDFGKIKVETDQIVNEYDHKEVIDE